MEARVSRGGACLILVHFFSKVASCEWGGEDAACGAARPGSQGEGLLFFGALSFQSSNLRVGRIRCCLRVCKARLVKGRGFLFLVFSLLK